MATVTYGKCYLWQTYYGKCNYGKSIYGKSIMAYNVTEPKLIVFDCFPIKVASRCSREKKGNCLNLALF